MRVGVLLLLLVFRSCLFLLFSLGYQVLATHDDATALHNPEEADTNNLPQNEQLNHPSDEVERDSASKLESSKEVPGDSADLLLAVHEQTNNYDKDDDDYAANSQGDNQIDIKYMTKLDDISEFLRDPMSKADLQSPVLQSYLSFEPNVTFVLTLTYSEKCPACQEMIDRFVEDIPQVWKDQQHDGDSFLIPGLPPPVLILLSVDQQDAQNSLTGQLEGFGTAHVPSLLWMVRDTLGYTFVLDFVATKSSGKLTSKEILQKYQHLQTRLLWLSSSMTFEEGATSFNLKPKYFSATNMDDGETVGNKTVASPIVAWFFDYGHRVFRSVVQSFPGSFLEAERDYAKWLWYENDEEADDGFLVLGQCRRPGDEADPLLTTFDRLAAAWVNRRDVVMVGITDCPNDELDTGKVYVWRRYSSFERFLDDNLDFSWSAAEKVISLDRSSDMAEEDLKNALVGATTPSILWLDRDLTAAIAFPHWRKVHAVLVIDIHRGGSSQSGGKALTPLDIRQANAFRSFRRTCREHQRKQFTEDAVCLVVPSTDVRVLTVFGIDIWTPLDLAAWKPEEEHPDPDILPVAFITDQRFGGTRRFYLGRDELEQPDGFANFWKSFWEDRLTPFPKSSPTSRTNKAGIHIITANDFQSQVLDRSALTEDRKHVLVLFTSSMCGHCRRLVAIWNQLARLVQRIGWSSFVELYQLDVSTDELWLDDSWNETIRWVPDLIYVSPEDSPRVVRYGEKDDYGDHVVGGIKSPMDLVDWFLRVASLDDNRLDELLLDVRRLLREQVSKTAQS
eukprot:scaffold2767_cov177-Amphora_coffeaeformis.AAC.86